MTPIPSRRRWSPLVIGSITLVLVLGGLSGCSSDDSDAQPVPGQSDFAPGAFDDLPRYPDSEPAGELSEDGDVVTQSFTVEGADPELVVDFYDNELTGWTTTGPDEAGEALRQDFTSPAGGDVLEVSAVVLSRGGTDVTQTVQYSLVLRQG